MKIQNLFALVVLCSLLFSCSDDDEESVSESLLEVLSGLDQSGIRNIELSEPIVLRLVNKKQVGIPDAQITFQITEGSGEIDKTQLITDQEGRVSFHWTLGNVKNNEIRIDDSVSSD